MSEQITLPNVRQGTDVTLRVTLTDSGAHVDWSTLSNIKAFLYSKAQRIVSGECAVSIDPEDNEKLICQYEHTSPEYLGETSIVVCCDYESQHNTYDKPAFCFVATTDETTDNGTTVEDESMEVDISVEDVSASILAGAIRTALEAAMLAQEKAAYADEKGDYADAQGDYAKAQGDYAKEQGDYAKAKGDYADEKGDYAKDQGDYAKSEIDGA